MKDEFFEMLFNKEDVTWQTMLYDLVRTEKMNPWDINIKEIAEKFFDAVQKMREMDFRISGKILLAAAIMLKIKSNQLLTKDLDAFDSLFAEDDSSELLMDDDFRKERYSYYKNAELIPRTPQARKRKISIYDLVDALQQAVEVKRRRVLRDVPDEVEIKVPEKKADISLVIKDIYGRIKSFFAANSNAKLTFSKLAPSDEKHDKVFTFIPLLHLTNQQKIDMNQDAHFGDIEISMMTAAAKKELQNELSELKA